MRNLLLVLLLAIPAYAHHTEDVRDELTGQWLGTSICTEPRGACHDETASYRFSKAKESDKVTVSANKIVDGEEQVMGVANYTVDAQKHTVSVELDSRRGPFRITLTWKGDQMTGTFTDSKTGRVLRNLAMKHQP